MKKGELLELLEKKNTAIKKAIRLVKDAAYTNTVIEKPVKDLLHLASNILKAARDLDRKDLIDNREEIE